jgi:LacI family fructose operon transcriptional repressor
MSMARKATTSSPRKRRPAQYHDVVKRRHAVGHLQEVLRRRQQVQRDLRGEQADAQQSGQDLSRAEAADSAAVSDNRWGARELTAKLIERSTAPRAKRRNRFCFVGGIPSDHNTAQRIEGFSDAIAAAFGSLDSADVDACGYEADQAEASVRTLYQRMGGLPRGLFVNSTIALEGVVRFLKTLPLEEVHQCTIGSYDWDPFATCLSFPLLMVRQDIPGLLGKAFEIIDSGRFDATEIIQIRPELVEA